MRPAARQASPTASRPTQLDPVMPFGMHGRGYRQRLAQVGQGTAGWVLQHDSHRGNGEQQVPTKHGDGPLESGGVPADKRRNLRHVKNVVPRGDAPTDMGEVTEVGHQHVSVEP